MKNQLVIVENDRPITTSKIIADTFDKPHNDVMKSVRRLVADLGDVGKSSQMFFETKIADKYDREQPAYLMTRDGFALLAMGFTGKKALKFKLAFIEEFNRMEKLIAELAKRQKKPQLDRDQRWQETRQLGKKTRKLLTAAIKSLEEYFEARGRVFSKGFLYGHLTNVIQNALGVQKGGSDIATVKKLNQLDQAEDIAGDTILHCLADGKIQSLAEIEAQILLQLKQLNKLLRGQLFLPQNIESNQTYLFDK